jgi:predicted TIM-barrel fold metal-dependent hydrolase
MMRQYKCISGDGHIDLNPDIWRERVQMKFRERAPKRVKMPNGSDAVVIDGGKPNTIGITRSVRVPHADLAKQVPTFETCAGTGRSEQRVSEQDQDGIDAEILFSQITFVLRQTEDDDLYRDCIRAYNEFLAEEYSAPAADRLICMGTLPTTGVEDAITEMEHCARLGLKGVKLDRYPSGKSYPTAADDKFWAASLDIGMALTNHNNGNMGSGRGEPDFLYPKVPGHDVHQKDAFKFFTRFSNDAMTGALQMAFAGVYDRFPRLQFYWAETMIGWLEYGLWQVDDHYRRYMGMIHDNWGLNRLERLPSEYLKERNYWGFLHDPVGVKRRAAIGYDKVMWGSDFAHAASEFPKSQKAIGEAFTGVPEHEKNAMLVDNCVRYFHLDGR